MRVIFGRRQAQYGPAPSMYTADYFHSLEGLRSDTHRKKKKKGIGLHTEKITLRHL